MSDGERSFPGRTKSFSRSSEGKGSRVRFFRLRREKRKRVEGVSTGAHGGGVWVLNIPEGKPPFSLQKIRWRHG